MSESDLFMECEEEELEPWQQIQENVQTERMEPFESISTVKQVTTRLPTVVTPAAVPARVPARVPVPVPVAVPAPVRVPAPVPVASTRVVLSGQALSGSSKDNRVSLLTNTQSLVTPLTSVPVPVPISLPAGLAKPDQGQQLIFTQGAGGLSTMGLSQVLLSAPAPGPGAAANQPIILTTQGLPVQNFMAGQNPLGIVLNVQQGQTIKPITLVSAPGTSIFKPAVGGAQIINQPAQLKTVQQIATVNRQAAPPTHTTTFTRVQIPATLTIRNTTPISQPKPTMVTLSSSLPSTSIKTAVPPTKIANASSLLTVKPAESSTERPKLVSLVNQPHTLLVLPSQRANGLPSSSAPTTQLNVQVSSNASSTRGLKICPRCGAQFKMIEALRGHMCFCCPDLTQAPSTSKVTPVQPPTDPKPIAPQKEADKIVMLVDDFYYGTYEGNRSNAAQDNLKTPMIFKCLSCGKKLRNNIRLMNHMKHHVELEQQNGEMDTHTSCQHCYRQFPTPFRLQCHLESVHSSYESSTKCKICEWAFETEPVFLQHMKNTHKPGEMPYVCQVCEYRSSFYSDVYNHFRTWHEDTRHLLCLYCLKVFKNSNSYQQHFSRHQKSTAYHCNKCRLQFLFTKEKLEHKMSHHKTFRRPQQLEGLSPGTKVTIRVHAQNKHRSSSSQPRPAPAPAPAPVTASVAQPRQETEPVKVVQPHTAPKPMQIIQQSRPSMPKKPISKMIELLNKFQEQRPLFGKQKCIECNYEVPDFSHHYPTYVHCSLCPYSTCCSRAYANHMINNHVSNKTRKSKGPTLPPPSLLRLICSDCDFTTFNGDMMAKHFVQNPEHSHSTCTPKASPSIGFTASGQGSHMWKNRGVDSALKPLEDDSMLERDPDEAMAPLEYSESDMEQMEDQMHTSAEEYEESSRNSGQDISEETHTLVAPPHSSLLFEPQCSAREQEEASPDRQLKTVLCALCRGINKAAEILATEPKLIEAWLREKEMQLELEAIDGIEAGGPVEWLVEWVLAQREQQLPVSEQNLFQKASEFHSQANQNSTFRASYQWAVRFMLQHNLGVQAIADVGRCLPASLEVSSQHFMNLVYRQIKQNRMHHSVIGAMDELSIYVDVDCLLDSATLDKKPAFQFVGSGRSLIDLHLCILADGTVLPTLLFFNGQLPSRMYSELPDCVLVEGKDEGFTEEEELNIWIERVWQKHIDAHSESKALLVLDDHCGHKVLSSHGLLNTCNTLPARIPTGCSFRHQPLEVCFRPVLQTFLSRRWDRLAEKGGAMGVTAGDVAELLVAWLVEALTCFSDQPEFIQRSFCLSKVVYVGEEEDKDPVFAQAEMMATLEKAMPLPEEMEPKVAKDEVPGDTTMTTTNERQVRDESQESHTERLSAPQAEPLSNTKKEQVAVIHANNKVEKQTESVNKAE